MEAADQLKAFCASCLCELHINQGQLDALYAVLREVKDGALSEDEALRRLERSPDWVWTAMDPESKLLLTDGYKDDLPAILTHLGAWVQPMRRQATGPAPKLRWLPLPELRSAQVVKTVRRRRLVQVKHRVVFGTLDRVKHVLAACGWQINTAFIERLNLSIRQHVAAVGRRVTTLCKGEDGLRQQLALYQVYYNFCLPHASVRRPLPQPEPTHGSGSATQWRPWTPAMAAGLTDHVWTLREVLRFRVPPWPQPAQV